MFIRLSEISLFATEAYLSDMNQQCVVPPAPTGGNGHSKRRGDPKGDKFHSLQHRRFSVSYTHLTLPTKRIV